MKKAKKKSKALKLSAEEYYERFIKTEIPHVIKDHDGDIAAIYPKKHRKDTGWSERIENLDGTNGYKYKNSYYSFDDFAQMIDYVLVLDWAKPDNSCYCEQCRFLNIYA